MTLREILTEGEGKLVSAGVPEAKLNAWYLFAHCFSMTKSQFFLRADEEAEDSGYRRYQELLDKRSRRIPLEQLTGETEFMGLPFFVNENVLIPRQDTECLVEEVLKFCDGADVLDLCTGSGCIGISLAKLAHCKSVMLSDISAEALKMAKKNAENNDVKVQIVESDLFQSIQGRFDLVVSNPPYIRSGEIPKLMPEVCEHEPLRALDGSGDGLLFYRSIIREIGAFLKNDATVFFEIGAEQGEAVSQLMHEAGFRNVEVKQDLAGLDRIVCGQYSK